MWTDEKPVVECSFITEFEDHIFVSVDAEAFLFLHDLISSYIKEKDRVVFTYWFNEKINHILGILKEEYNNLL